MREIKFRAWDKDSRRMIHLGSHGALRYDDDAAKLVFGEDWHDDFSTSRTRNFELMQFTGRKDAVGREIYEGDIVKAVSVKAARIATPFTGCVYWHEHELQWWITDGTNDPMHGVNYDLTYLYCFEDFQVIGNIYEHPQFLEQRP